ncbi:MAG: WD40 repeat domain-containing protein [Verrucomicrobia bacterium]|nr:WD40 repeat domain-containing protein [Verrucomicrobiota bacterium]
MASVFPDTSPDLTSASPPGLWEYFHDPVSGFLRPDSPRPVLIFDQFEEIFTLAPAAGRRDEAESFRDALASLVENRPPGSLRLRMESDDTLAEHFDFQAQPCKVLLALREDFLHLLERWRGAMPSLMANRLELRLLNGPQALRAVIEPGRKRPGQPPIIAEETAAAIVRFVAGANADKPLSSIDAVPPLLSLICAELNAQRFGPDGLPLQASVESTQLQGKSEDILLHYYEETFAPHPPEVRCFVEDRLLSADGSFRESVAEATALRHLTNAGLTKEQADAAIKDLVDQRLLVTEERGGTRRIELTHDILTGVARLSREREEKAKAALDAEAARERELAQRRRLRRSRQLAAALAVLAIVAGIALRYGISKERVAVLALGIVEERNSQIEDKNKQSRKMLADASRLSHEAAIYRLRQATIGDGRIPEAMAYLAKALAFDSSNTAAQATAAIALTSRGSAIGPRWPLASLRSSVPISISPDGLTLATAEDTTASKSGPAINSIFLTELRDGFTRRKLADVAEKIYAITFHPNGHILGVRKDDRVVLLNLDGASPTEIKIAHPELWHFKFSPDGLWCATGSLNHTARIWDTNTGQPVSPWLKHENQVTELAFSADSSKLLTAECLNDSARIWAVPSGEPLGEPIRLKGPIDAASFTPDGRTVVTGERWGSIQFWDVAARKPWKSMLQLEMFVNVLCFYPDGRSLIAACRGPEAVLARLNQPEISHTKLKHEGQVNDGSFSPDGKWVVTASQDGTARVWEVSTGNPVCEPLPHPQEVLEARFAPCGDFILTRSVDNTLRIWSIPIAVPNGRIIASNHESAILALLTKSPKGTKLSSPQSAAIEQLLTGGTLSEGEKPRPLSLGSILLSADRKNLLALDGSRTPGSADGRLWRTSDWTLTGVASCPVNTIPSKVTFSSDGARLYVEGYDIKIDSDSISGFDTGTGKPLGSPLMISPSLDDIVISPDGKLLAVLHTLRGIQIYRTPKLEPTLKKWIDLDQASFETLQFSADSKILLTASGGANTADLWDVETGQHTGTAMKHYDHVNSAAFSSDGEWIITASNDRTVGVWDARTQEPIISPLVHPSAVKSVALSRNRRWMVSSTDSYYTRGGFFLWEAPTGRLVADLGACDSVWFGETPNTLCLRKADVLQVLELQETREKEAAEWHALLELQAGLRIDEQAVMTVLPPNLAASRLAKLRKTLDSTEGETEATQLIRWYLENPRTRPITPRASIHIPQFIENTVSLRLKYAAPASHRSDLEEAYRVDPLHPLMHLALANVEANPDTALLLRTYGVQQRLLAPENEQLYGKETLARYARTSVRLLCADASLADGTTSELITKAFSLALKLEPGHAELKVLEKLMQEKQRAAQQ